MIGLVVDGGGFELLAGDERVGPRRPLEPADVALLESLALRYARAVRVRADPAVLVELGRELWRWLDGDRGALDALLERAPARSVFEVRGPRTPSDGAWAVLRAPFELLARPGGGFLAEDELERPCVVRRLGTPVPPPEPDGYRLGLAFMASAPHGQHELDFEAEEAAILGAVGRSRIDLLVDDTGDPVQLGHRLADWPAMPAVHLSCHGTDGSAHRPGTPVLLMEDELGELRPTTAAELVDLLPATTRLVVVSACRTASTAAGHPPGGAPGRGRPVAHSLATALVTAGVPAVVGWDGPVDDRAATAFAERLYGALSDRADLAAAVGDARRALLRSDDAAVRADWHLARLWLGPAGGGPLVGGTGRRLPVSATHGTRTFLDRKRQVPVAAAAMFVDRRPELQRALRALRAGERVGVLLHGQGRLGKSSLAARIADRFPDRAVAVVFGDYSAAAVLDAVGEAVRADPAAREVVARGRAEVRHRPEALEDVLVDLLHGPCAEAADGHRPLLLIVDDLEQVLVAAPDGPHRVAPEHAPVLTAVLGAFDPELDSRLILTSRFTFALDDLGSRLEPVQLRPLSDVGRRKLHRRQQALVPPERRAARAHLAELALAVSRGNPGLQDLVGLRLVYGEQVPVQRARAAVADLEAYLARGELPADGDVRTFLDDLGLDAVLADAGGPHRELLRALTLFDLPVPEPVVDELAAEAVGGSPDRLRGLGLLAPHRDLHDPARPAWLVDPLAAGRLEPLTDRERAAVAAVAVGPLLAAWGGATPARRAAELDRELTRLGLAGDDAAVVAACAPAAVWSLRHDRAVDALRWARAAIALLDRSGRDVPLALLRGAADAAFTSGAGDGDALLQRAVRRVETDGGAGTDPCDGARVLAERARRLVVLGEPQEAGRLLRRAHELLTAAGSDAEAAAVLSDLAELAVRRGEYDEALRVLRDVVLPVHRRLGDTRAVAVTWGQIADVAFRRGDHDEALRIRRDVTLPAYQDLGDTHSVALTWGKIADIADRRGEDDEALRIRREIELPAYGRRGDVRAVAITWGKIADVAARRGEHDEALRIHRDTVLPALERVGDLREIVVTWAAIAALARRTGDHAQAAAVHRRRLALHARLGDADGVAAALLDLAETELDRGDQAAARCLLVERDEVLRRLGRSAEAGQSELMDLFTELFRRRDEEEDPRT